MNIVKMVLQFLLLIGNYLVNKKNNKSSGEKEIKKGIEERDPNKINAGFGRINNEE